MAPVSVVRPKNLQLPRQPKLAGRQQERDRDEDISRHWRLPVRPTLAFEATTQPVARSRHQACWESVPRSLPGCNYDSPTVGDRNQILSVDILSAIRSTFFDSNGQVRPQSNRRLSLNLRSLAQSISAIGWLTVASAAERQIFDWGEQLI